MPMKMRCEMKFILTLFAAFTLNLSWAQVITDPQGDTLFYINGGDIEFRGALEATVTGDLYMAVSGDTLGWIDGDSILCCNNHVMGCKDGDGVVKLWSDLYYGSVETSGDIRNMYGDIVANRGSIPEMQAIALCLFFFETYDQ